MSVVTPIHSHKFCSHGKKLYGDDCPQCELLWEQWCLRNAEDAVAQHKANIDKLTGGAHD